MPGQTVGSVLTSEGRFIPVLVACLKSRSVGTALCVVLIGTACLVIARDYGYFVSVSAGYPPRPVTAADVITVTGAAVLPAVCYPALWIFERVHRRPLVRAVAAVMAPSAILVVSFSELGLQAVGFVPQSRDLGLVCLANGVAYGSLSVVLTVRFGRRVGPVVALAAYLVGVVGQAITVPVPLPFEQSTAAGQLVGLFGLAASVMLLQSTLGRGTNASREDGGSAARSGDRLGHAA